MTKRKGFTLIEILIVLVVIGVLSSMMSISSSSSTDTAKATAIIGNLVTIKKAALVAYMESNDVASATESSRVLQGVAEYMSTTETAIKNASFDIKIGDRGATPWYVFFDASVNKQNTNVKKILGQKAKEMNLIDGGGTSGTFTAGAVYAGTADNLIGLRIH